MPAIPNILLRLLPRKDYLHLASGLTPVALKFGQILYEPGKPMRDVYFPSACLVSLLTIAEGHLALEVGMVGREGMLGIPLALGIANSPVRALVQGEGPAMRMSKTRFLAEIGASPPMRRAVLTYVHSLMGQITQTAACNRFHLVEGRLARWLLMTRDRVASGEFRMTHEFLSHMLGVRREGVSEAAAVFQDRHLIEYSRGKIRVLDHGGLETAACSCYRGSPKKAGDIPHWRPTRRYAAAAPTTCKDSTRGRSDIRRSNSTLTTP